MYPRILAAVFSVTVLLLVLTGCPLDPPGDALGHVYGHVYWNTSGVLAARVQIKTGNNFYTGSMVAETVTNATGAFSIEDVPVGDFTIYAVKPFGSTEYWDWCGRPITIVAGAQINAGTMYLSKIMTLLEPALNSPVATNPPTFSWDPVGEADHYSLTLYQLTDPPSLEFHVSGITTTSFKPASPLASGYDYEWFVDAFSSACRQIAYYSSWYFTVP